MANKKQYKHTFNKTEQAAYNIQTGKGWQCPTCGSFIPAGDDICYACGEMPELNAMKLQNTSGRTHGYDFYSSSNSFPFSLFWLSSTFLMPVLYGLNIFLEYSISYLLFVPILYVLTRSVIELLQELEDVTNGEKMSWTALNRLWVFYFSIKAIIPIIKTIFIDFISL